MSLSEQITEFTVFQLREGVNLEDVASSTADLAVQTFIQLTNTVKSQDGFIRQFWVNCSLSISTYI
jgi:hypothetical protein